MAQTAPACVRPGSAQAPHVSVDAVLAAAVPAVAVRAPEPVTAAGAALARDAPVRVPTATTAAEEPRSVVLSLRTQFPSRRRGSWAPPGRSTTPKRPSRCVHGIYHRPGMTGKQSNVPSLDRIGRRRCVPPRHPRPRSSRAGGGPSRPVTPAPYSAAMPDAIEVRKIPLQNVSDASGLAELIDAGVVEADRVLAVIGKTEGNGGVNDYTRIIADRAFREVLMAKGSRDRDAVMQVPIVWSGGTDGVLSPHATLFASLPPDPSSASLPPAPPDAGSGKEEPRLTVGFAMSEQLLPEDIGRTTMIEKVAAAVTVAMERAGITDAGDVHYVQTKTPLLTIHTIRDAKSRGKTVWTEHTHESMDLSNGCTALGVAVALAEIDMPGDEDVMHDRSLYSAVASCSSGVELDRAQVVVVGNARGVGGRYRIGHSVMRDALDADGIWGAIKDAGLDLPDRPHSSDLRGRLVNVFLKCEASQDGQVRGRRNAMLDDSDVHWHRQIKATVGGVTAAVTGDPAVFVSVSAAHQGPDGGGPVAAIVALGAMISGAWRPRAAGRPRRPPRGRGGKSADLGPGWRELRVGRPVTRR